MCPPETTTVRVIIVMLRRPKRVDPREARSDPYWEFGSFGSTRCHTRNLMNPRRAEELNGARLAFAQGGPEGIRLVHVTSPIRTHVRHKGTYAEARWDPPQMPLRYERAPLLIGATGQTDCPLLIDEIRTVRRTGWVGKFASAFRSRRRPLAGVIGAQLLKVYEATRRPSSVANSYIDALPYPPPHIENPRERKRRYRANIHC